MKNHALFLACFSTLAFVACDAKSGSKTTDKTPGAATVAESANNLMSCEIAGKAWNSSELSDVSSIKMTVNIAASNVAEKSMVVLRFPREKAVEGSVIAFKFKMGQVAEAGVTIRTLDGTGNVLVDLDDSAPEGAITITKTSKTHVEGTFMATSKKNTVTNGTFAMELTKTW